MTDIKNPHILYLKGALFLLLAILSASILILEALTLERVALLAICIWASCRAYYFAFYVIEHYVDPSYRFAGLFDFLRYLVSARQERDRARPSATERQRRDESSRP